MKLGLTVLACFVLLTVPQILCGQGRLGTIRKEVQTPPEEDNRESEPQHHHHRCDDDDDDNDNDDDVFLVFTFDDDDPQPPREPAKPGDFEWFPNHPYPHGLPGYAQEPNTSIAHLTGEEGDILDLKLMSLRLQLENGNDFAGLNRFNGQLLLEMPGLAYHTSWNHYRETLNGQEEDAIFGNFHFLLNFPTTYFEFRLGPGFNIYTDDYNTDFGVNLMFGLDMFLQPPFILSTQIDSGTLGYTTTWHTRATAGCVLYGVELYGGYDLRQIGSVSIHGPLLGLRLWF